MVFVPTADLPPPKRKSMCMGQFLSWGGNGTVLAAAKPLAGATGTFTIYGVKCILRRPSSLAYKERQQEAEDRASR